MKYVTKEEIAQLLESVKSTESEIEAVPCLEERENGMTDELREAIKDRPRFRKYLSEAGFC